jgi:hypothetical protein
LSSVQHCYLYNASNGAISNFLGSYYCKRTQAMANSCPNYQDIPSRKLLVYLLEFGLLTYFGRLSADDRPNYESSESRGTRAISPKSEQKTMTIDQK